MNKHRLTPFFMGLCVVFGIFLGVFYTKHYSRSKVNIIAAGENKLGNLLEAINYMYVDNVRLDTIIENSIPLMLKELDPHSVYINATDMTSANDDLRGAFSGIGVSFSIQKDTVVVMQIIKGGPSEKVGMLPGDRIVTANQDTLVGMKDIDVMKKLKGEKGSTVKLGVIRPHHKEPMTFSVTRDDIPMPSVDVHYMLDNTTGYISVDKFGEQTYSEFIIALGELSMKGMKNLIVDLRGNTGGIMQTAILMANEFLPRNRMIVYTQGAHFPREDYYSDGNGSFQDLPLTVLVDEISASASEIFAGAMQDNDRALVIGRRTFGKGLVQQQIEFKDGSALRLTVARYHSPSGRCIQKPYQLGHGEDYEMELIERYERGEYFFVDSIKQDGEEYHTLLGRPVYGGGGITPDIFVAEDTANISSYYREAVINGYVRGFTYDYTDENREVLSHFTKYDDLEKYLVKQNLLEKFATHAEKAGLQRRNLMLQQNKDLFEHYIIGSIIYNCMTMQEYREYTNKTDKTVKKALEIIKQGKTKPKAGIRY